MSKPQQQKKPEVQPETLWKSEEAKRLVEAVPAPQREPLLGDVMERLLPHARGGEAAEDVLVRLMRERDEAMAQRREAQDDAMRWQDRMRAAEQREREAHARYLTTRSPETRAELHLREVGATVAQRARAGESVTQTVARLVDEHTGMALVLEKVTARRGAGLFVVNESPIFGLLLVRRGEDGALEVETLVEKDAWHEVRRLLPRAVSQCVPAELRSSLDWEG